MPTGKKTLRALDRALDELEREPRDDPELDVLQQALLSVQPKEGAEAIDPTLVQRALDGDLTNEERDTVLDRMSGAPDQIRDWMAARATLELGHDDTGRLADGSAIAESSDAPPGPRARGASWRWLRPAGAGSIAEAFGAGRLAWVGAAMVLLVLALVLTQLNPPVYRGGGESIRLLVEEGATLQRDDFVLRWDGPEGATYTLTLFDASLDPFFVASDLVDSEYLVPPPELSSVTEGEPVAWRIDAITSSGDDVSSDPSTVYVRD